MSPRLALLSVIVSSARGAPGLLGVGADGTASHAEYCRARDRAEVNALAKMVERQAWTTDAVLPLERQWLKSMPADTYQSALLFSAYYPCMFTLEKTTSVQEHFDSGRWLCGVREVQNGDRIMQTRC
jgi:hypothetical protein